MKIAVLGAGRVGAVVAAEAVLVAVPGPAVQDVSPDRYADNGST